MAQSTLSAICGKRPPPESAEQRKEKTKSPVWDHYVIDKTKPGYAKCVHCDSWFSCKGSGTSNITRHLEREHREFQVKNMSRAPPSATKISQETKARIDGRLVEFIVIDSQPFFLCKHSSEV